MGEGGERADGERQRRERDQKPAEISHAADYNPLMKTHIAFAAVVVLAVAVTTFAQGPGPRRDGKWEVKMEMDMAGMPNMPAGMQMPAFTSTQCVTPEEAKDPQKAIPQGGRGGRGPNPENCKVSDYKTDGNKVSWSMKCEGNPPMSGNGEFVYAADSYTGTMKMDRGGQLVTMKYSGKRLGDCDKK